MASEFPASSSSQQPFATPQPAPVTAASQTTSPPTKQSLKSWWKGFRPPPKSQETQGRSFFSSAGSASTPEHGHFHASAQFTTQIQENIHPIFTESPMNSTAPVIDGLPPVEVSPTSSGSKTSTFNCFHPSQRIKRIFRHRRKSSSSLRKLSALYKMRKEKADNASKFRGVFNKRAGSGQRRISTANCNSRGRKGSLSSKRFPDPYTPEQILQFYDSVKLRIYASYTFSYSRENAKQFVQLVEQPAGIFGVPLRQSITYANVAISLVDAEGKSYIYGYVPIVVAKCGVYLKEKATNVEGIFRLSGSEKRIKELKTIFDSPDRYGKGLDWAGYTVHDAANVLRRYLNLLPEPIVPLDLYDRFREPLRGHTKQAVGDNEGPQLDESFDVGKAIVTYQKLITELPPLNRQLLLYILDLLAVFASKSDENRMNSQNLAAIFQPGMLSHPQHDMAPMEYRLSQDVLIFLIENQDHFLIGMRGTAADEKTVQEVQSGGTPPMGTPTSKNAIGRSSSNASAGADSVRKFGGVRRNVSVSSRHSRQSNGAPSPATPTYGATLTTTASGGVHRSNTVPSKKSPGLPQGRLQKNSHSPSPTSALSSTSTSQPAAPRGLSPSAPLAASAKNPSPTSPAFPPSVAGASSLAPSLHAASALTSQERLLSDPEKHSDVGTPTRERNVTSFFQRSPTVDSEKKQPNKLRKKRIPSSSNPSAQSSTHSLHGTQPDPSPALQPVRDTQEPTESTALETIPSANPFNPNSDATPPATETPRAEQSQRFPSRSEELHQSSDKTLKPNASPGSSLHSRSSFNDQSDLDHVDDSAAAEQKEKRSRWRLSRRREEPQQLGRILSPPRTLGSDAGAGASSSSIGSSARPRKSFTADTVAVGSESTLVGTHLQTSNESGSAVGSGEEKKGPLGWIKNKMREKREEKEAEKDRNKSPPASTDRLAAALPTRGKSVDLKREEHPVPPAEDSTPSTAQQPQR